MQQTERSWLTLWLVCKYLINAIIYRVEFVWAIILHQPIQDNEYAWLAYSVCVWSQFCITHSFDSWVCASDLRNILISWLLILCAIQTVSNSAIALLSFTIECFFLSLKEKLWMIFSLVESGDLLNIALVQSCVPNLALDFPYNLWHLEPTFLSNWLIFSAF